MSKESKANLKRVLEVYNAHPPQKRHLEVQKELQRQKQTPKK